jgi:hypothetical protein
VGTGQADPDQLPCRPEPQEHEPSAGLPCAVLTGPEGSYSLDTGHIYIRNSKNTEFKASWVFTWL